MISFLLALTQAKDARATLLTTLNHYRSLKSFSMEIRQHDGSGLYPGDFTQTLRWRSDGRFELKVTKQPDLSKPGSKARLVPDFYASEGQVVRIYPDGRRETSSLAPEPNVMPGWDVCGGPILSFLQNTTMADLLQHPPTSMNIEFSFGTAHTFAGQEAKDIACGVKVGSGVKSSLHWNLSRDGRQLLAVTSEAGGIHGESRYVAQVENCALPATLGQAPPERGAGAR